MLCGVAVILLPFIGFLSSWDTVISVILGLIIVALAYMMAPASPMNATTNAQATGKASNAMPFVEHTTSTSAAAPSPDASPEKAGQIPNKEAGV